MKDVPTREFLWRGVRSGLSLNLRVGECKFIAADNAGPIRHVAQLSLRGIRIPTIHIPRSREVSSKCAESCDERASGDVYVSNHVQRKAVLHDYQREEQEVGCKLHEIYGTQA